MAKNTETFPVSKGDSGKFFGYADAGQIARSKGVLKLFDADKADKIKIENAIAKEAEADKAAEAAKKAAEGKGGADAGAVKKGPAAK